MMEKEASSSPPRATTKSRSSNPRRSNRVSGVKAVNESTTNSYTGDKGTPGTLFGLLETVIFNPYVFPSLVLGLVAIVAHAVSVRHEWSSEGITTFSTFFLAEVAYHVLLPAFPFVVMSYLGAEKRALDAVTICGALYSLWLFYQNVLACWMCISWPNFFASTGTTLFFYNTIAIYAVWTIFIFLEGWRQCGRLSVWPYFILSLVLGVDTVAPIYFIRHRRLEEMLEDEEDVKERVEKRKRGCWAWAYGLVIIATVAVVTPVAYIWASEDGDFSSKLQKVFNSMAAERTLYMTMFMFTACTSFFLPQIKGRTPPTTWYLRVLAAGLLALNPAVGWAVILMFRELTPNRTFVEAKTPEPPADTLPPVQIYFAGFVGLYIRIVLFSALGFAYSLIGMQKAFVCLAGMLVFEYFFNRGLFNWDTNLRLAQWMKENRFTVALEFIVSVLMLFVSWGDSPFMPDYIRLLLISWQTLIWDVCLTLGLAAAAHMIFKAISHSGSPLPAGLKVFMILSFALLLFAKYDAMEAQCTLRLGKEYVDPDPEWEAQFGKIIRDLVRDVAAHSRDAHRLQHHKMHGCVLANFTINRLIAPQVRHGLFSNQGQTYPAIIRFSNGAGEECSDSDKDVRAMSIKLMNVTGPKSLTPKDLGYENTTQDFILLSSDVFFTNDIISYPSLIQAKQQGNAALLKWVFHSWNPFEWRLSVPYMVYLLISEGAEVVNPLNWRYYSTTPYRLGKYSAVKYSARPCFGYPTPERKSLDEERKDRDADHFLRGNMYSQLQEEDACFDFMVQLQTDACAQPIEDPTVSWPGGWATVATIRIPKQQFLYKSQVDYCQDLSYNPWHSLIEHKPLGAVNYARKPAYGVGAHTRRSYNGVNETDEPTVEKFEATRQGPIYVDKIQGAGNTAEFNYASYPYPFHHLPKRIQSLPPSQEFDTKSQNRMTQWYLRTRFNFFSKDQDHNSRKFSSFAVPDDYKCMFESNTWLVTPLEPPPIVARWKEDSEFARQFISGVNPVIIRCVNSDNPLPEALDLSKKQLALVNRKLKDAYPYGNDTFASLQETGRLFFVDYEILDDIAMKEDRLFYTPIAVFYLDHNNRFMPLLIQLTRYEGEHNEIFIAPNNNDKQKQPRTWYQSTTKQGQGEEGMSKEEKELQERIWLFARMHVMQSDSIVHEMVSHLGFTHLAMEPIVIGFYRQLAPGHPIYQLMTPHFRNTLAINDFGRGTLLSPTNSVFDRIMGCGLAGSLQLMQKAYNEYFNLMNRSFPREMAARGFTEVAIPGSADDNLPGYYYRDDGFKLWHALEDYVSSVVHRPDVYGVGEEADLLIQKDDQLQALVRELRDPLMGAVPGVPDLESTEELIEFLTNILFTCTAQHSAVNFGQFDAYAFPPNRPLHLVKPMPDDKSMLTNAYIMASLPDELATMDIISVSKVLSLPAYDQRDPLTNATLGYTLSSMPLPKEFPFTTEYNKFVKVLDEQQAVIEKRNALLETPYTYLAPAEAASSIAI